jgi:Asp-tRNA(Asn)/Glu-tRNA(Gln) amidotransferase A subunit family amidase
MSGGSSSGSAALVGAGGCDVALGTDTGGSIRIPAHFCGVVGFKPTFAALSTDGVTPLAPSLDHVGLLAHDVATTTQVFAALTGADPVSAPASFRIGILADQLDAARVGPEMAAAIGSAARVLSAGFDVTELPWPAFWDIGQAYDDILLAEAWQVHREAVERDPSHFGPGTLNLLLSGSKVSRDSYQAALHRRDELAPLASAAYDQAEILLSPAAAMVAPPADARIRPGGGLFTRSYNITGAPAIVLPCGWSGDGLPIGLQLSARRGADMLLLAAASRIEEALSFPRRQPAVA